MFALAATLALVAAQPAPPRIVSIIPLGAVDPSYIRDISDAITQRVNVVIRVEPRRELPATAWYEPRRRWRAERILEAINADLPSGAWKAIALTNAEISTTKDTYEDWRVGGLGDIGGKSCVVSAFIFRKHSPTTEILLRRLADLAVHELGHTLGLPHCASRGCVMRDAQGKILESVDSSTGEYCAVCRMRLPFGLLK